MFALTFYYVIITEDLQGGAVLSVLDLGTSETALAVASCYLPEAAAPPTSSSVTFAEDGRIGIVLEGFPLGSYAVSAHLTSDAIGTHAVIDQMAVSAANVNKDAGRKLLELIGNGCLDNGIQLLETTCQTPSALETRELVFGKTALRCNTPPSHFLAATGQFYIPYGRARNWLRPDGSRSILVTVLLEQSKLADI